MSHFLARRLAAVVNLSTSCPNFISFFVFENRSKALPKLAMPFPGMGKGMYDLGFFFFRFCHVRIKLGFRMISSAAKNEAVLI